MYLNNNRMSILFACIFFIVPIYSCADELPQNNINAPCSNPVQGKTMTPYSIVTYMSKPNGKGSDLWICVDDKLVLAAGIRDGRQSYFGDAESEYLREAGKLVKRDGKRILLRMVIEENNFRELFNSFWLLDFRNKEFLLVGPMVAPERGGPFDVIWYEDSVIVTFHAVGGTQLGRFDYQPNWGKEERKFVKDVAAEIAESDNAKVRFVIDNETNEDMTIPNLPLMNKDGVFHPGKRNYINMPHDRLALKGKPIPSTVKKGEDKVKNARSIYPGYHYDYKTKKLTAVAIEED